MNGDIFKHAVGCQQQLVILHIYLISFHLQFKQQINCRYLASNTHVAVEVVDSLNNNKNQIKSDAT